MRFFVWVDFQFEILAVCIGLICAILIYAAWAGYPKREQARTLDEIDDRMGREPHVVPHTEKNPVVPFLIYTYAIIAVWSFSYVIYIWASSGNF